MKRFLFSMLFAVVATLSGNAQDWSAVLNSVDGLPGEAEAYYGELYYRFASQTFTPGTSVDKIRLTVLNTRTDEAPNGNNVIFSLSGLTVYDGNGTPVDYIAYSNADHNSLAYNSDGEGLPALNDNDIKSYFHSMWSSPGVSDRHYIELSLAKSVSSFRVEWTTRLGENKNDPTVVALTLGTEYKPEEVGSEFALGARVSKTSVLATKNQLFVLKSNAVKSFSASNGTTYIGSGPLYMQCAEKGDGAPSASHVMQLIPAGNGRYLVYWPLSGVYLANSAAHYNGLNGWQYSTDDFMEAARVQFIERTGGYFEMMYDGTNSAGEQQLYVGAEMRDGVSSKMKTFDLAHKEALESGDYTQGYALPIAFNWSVYKANLNSETVTELYVGLPLLGGNYLRPIMNKANTFLSKYGNHDGNCAGEDTALRNTISMTESELSSISMVSRIEELEDQLLEKLSHYMAVGLVKYENRVRELLANSTFSEYPYPTGTYPMTSRAILESLQSTLALAREKAGVYNAEQYEAVFTQADNDIERFLSTKVENGTTPGGGESGGGETGGEEEVVDSEIVYVYLSNGDVDAYMLSTLDGDYYTAAGKLYFPIKNGDLMYYTAEEYDSCSSVRPQLPYMTSFKFNNKYNPNLNVDAEAADVTEKMHFSLNAIGKWLTASFQLSDEKAVAFVDTTLQVSKVTRQSFANKVTYKVTYPGYNIFESVKVQDEIWSTPAVGGDTVEVQLTASMLATNKPSTQSNEGLGNLLDGNPNTIFHSTWGSANNATANLNANITIDLPESLNNIQIYYMCRPQRGYNPKIWEIYVSNDSINWKLVRTLDYIADGMPTGGAGQEYTSPTIDLGGNYSKLRIVQTYGEYSKNHLALAELRVFKVVENTSTGEPVKIQDAVYENRYRPFGREYKVDIEWLTDNAVSVPRIDIDIDGGKFVTSKSTYLKANFRINGYGVYENFEDSVQIKGRGNSSWSYSKKPYRLKFAEKVKPFGLTKGKSWVLLANAQSGSLMANAIAMKIGQMAGSAYANHIIPVELYMNGRYMGSYMFTEKVGMANNSVDIDEELGYLLELDTYSSSDEPIYTTGSYSLPVKVSEPDLLELPSSESSVRLNSILNDVKEMSSCLYNNGDINDVLDVETTARFFLANDYVLNQEINHPKSTFLYKDESDPNGKLTFGPIWDFDWGFGYEANHSYCYNGATNSIINVSMNAHMFWDDLKTNSVFKRYYYKVWKEFLEKNSIDELMDYIDSYYEFAKESFVNNQNEWGYSAGFTKDDAERAKEWLVQRKNYLYNGLSKSDIEDLIHALAGDVNCNDQLTVHDVALVTAYMNGYTHKDLNLKKADCDGNGSVGDADVAAVAACVIGSEAPSSMYWYKTTLAAGELNASDFNMEQGEEVVLPLNLVYGYDELYNALQFDVKVPEGVYINDIVAGEALSDVEFDYAELAANTYRVVAYTSDNEALCDKDAVVANISLQTFSVIEEPLRKVEVCNVYAVNENNDEVRLDNVSISFAEATGIDATLATMAVKGGSCITITALEDQVVKVYSMDGRLICRKKVAQGTTRIDVPAGIYLVNGNKVLVY